MSEAHKNYYDILEIPTSASQDEIFHAYQRIKNTYSQDNLALYSLMSSYESEEVLNSIEEAYTILGEPDKRRKYDHAKGITTGVHRLSDYNLNEQKSTGDATNPTREIQSQQISHGASSPATASSLAQAQENEFKLGTSRGSDVSKIAASKKFSLQYTPNPEFEQEIEQATVYTGELLRKIREYKNVDIPRLSEMTRISKTYIKNIEDEAVDNLPAPTYTRGFVFQYAKCLKLNPDYVASSYMGRIQSLSK